MAFEKNIKFDDLVPRARQAIQNREKSPLDKMRDADPTIRRKFFESLDKEEFQEYMHHYHTVSRPSQLYPGSTHPVILYQCGRGWGKTQTASMIIRYLVENEMVPKDFPSIGIIGKTVNDVKKTMINGPSGIIACADPYMRPVYRPSDRLLEWGNGIKAMTFSADEYEQLRGPNLNFVWADELCKFGYQQEIIDQVNFALRLGKNPQLLVTTTPKPTDAIIKMATDPSTLVIQRPSYDNFNNLPERYIEHVFNAFERGDPDLTEQEIYGEILKANPNAIFHQDIINRHRHIIDVDGTFFEKELLKLAATMDQIVISIDPAVSEDEDSDNTGIMVLGIKEIEEEFHGYVFEDGTLKGDADDWAGRAIQLYDKYNAAYIVVEKNQGGNMITSVIHNNRKAIQVELRQSVKSKGDRARPVGALYKQGLIHHVGHTGNFGDDTLLELETECCRFNPKLGKKQKSPDRMDALVIGFNELFEAFDGSDFLFEVLD